MDGGLLGGLIGIGFMAIIGIGLYLYDRIPEDDHTYTHNPPPRKLSPFKVKNLFNHVQI
jgi:hypothetical protein